MCVHIHMDICVFSGVAVDMVEPVESLVTHNHASGMCSGTYHGVEDRTELWWRQRGTQMPEKNRSLGVALRSHPLLRKESFKR